jgi:hypothetical protein
MKYDTKKQHHLLIIIKKLQATQSAAKYVGLVKHLSETAVVYVWCKIMTPVFH